MSKAKVGDRIRVTTRFTGEVTEIEGRVALLDTGDWVALEIPEYLLGQGRLTVEKLKHERPEVGAVIDGQRLRDTWWKRGTVVVDLEDPLPDGEPSLYVLRPSGKWFSPHYGNEVAFEDIGISNLAEIAYLP